MLNCVSEHNPMQKSPSGFVLLIVLLLLAVIAMVAMGALTDVALTSKMSNDMAQQTIAFYKAEQALRKAEDDLVHGKHKSKYRHIQQECGVDFYLAEGKASVHGANVTLQSTVAIVDKSAHCQPPPSEITGRQAWVYP